MYEANKFLNPISSNILSSKTLENILGFPKQSGLPSGIANLWITLIFSVSQYFSKDDISGFPALKDFFKRLT